METIVQPVIILTQVELSYQLRVADDGVAGHVVGLPVVAHPLYSGEDVQRQVDELPFFVYDQQHIRQPFRQL